MKRCYTCMNKISGDSCKHCNGGANQNQELSTSHIVPGTVLISRYLVGYCLDENGEGITYIGFDSETGKRVHIREFYPTTLVERVSPSKVVKVKSGLEIQYKSCMSDHIELSKILIQLSASNNCVQKALDIFALNNTVYTIYEDISGTTLNKFIRVNYGEISFQQLDNMILPLLYTIRLLNANDIIHRGISTDTIIVTPNNEFKLIGFSLSATRTMGSELEATLYDGYSAPEQYSSTMYQGSWTDVYAICSVLYKCLTGAVVPCATERLSTDILTPNEINTTVPLNVSDAIMNGLEYDYNNRTQNISQLLGEMFTQTDRKTSSIVKKSVGTKNTKIKKKKKKSFRIPIWLIVFVIVSPLMMLAIDYIQVILLGEGYGSDGVTSDVTVSQSDSFIPTDTTSDAIVSSNDSDSTYDEDSQEVSGVKVVVESFVGKKVDDVLDSITFGEMFEFDVRYEYNGIAPFGEIMKQSPEANSIVVEGQIITLNVSYGPEVITVQSNKDAVGNFIELDDYVEDLMLKGVEVIVREAFSDDIPKGMVVGTNYVEGTTMNRKEINEITVFVSLGVDETTVVPDDDEVDDDIGDE